MYLSSKELQFHLQSCVSFDYQDPNEALIRPDYDSLLEEDVWRIFPKLTQQ